MLKLVLCCLESKNLTIKNIFASNWELKEAIRNGNRQDNWRLQTRINEVLQSINSAGHPNVHLIPRKWAGVAHCLAIHGANLHELSLYHQGRDLPKWIMKKLLANNLNF